MKIPLIYLALVSLHLLAEGIEAFQCIGRRSHVLMPSHRPPYSTFLMDSRYSWRRRALFQEEEETSKGFLFQDNAKTVRIENDAHADEIHKKEDEDKGETDMTEQQFSVGDSVRVIIPDIRAYQIPAAHRGSYENGVFVANESIKYLVLPVGLQGTVEKVYDASGSILSANLPIRVSFTKSSDENRPQPPIDFTMYFALSELELVTD